MAAARPAPPFRPERPQRDRSLQRGSALLDIVVLEAARSDADLLRQRAAFAQGERAVDGFFGAGGVGEGDVEPAVAHVLDALLGQGVDADELHFFLAAER